MAVTGVVNALMIANFITSSLTADMAAVVGFPKTHADAVGSSWDALRPGASASEAGAAYVRVDLGHLPVVAAADGDGAGAAEVRLREVDGAYGWCDVYHYVGAGVQRVDGVQRVFLDTVVEGSVEAAGERPLVLASSASIARHDVGAATAGAYDVRGARRSSVGQCVIYDERDGGRGVSCWARRGRGQQAPPLPDAACAAYGVAHFGDGPDAAPNHSAAFASPRGGGSGSASGIASAGASGVGRVARSALVVPGDEEADGDGGAVTVGGEQPAAACTDVEAGDAVWVVDARGNGEWLTTEGWLGGQLRRSLGGVEYYSVPEPASRRMVLRDCGGGDA